MNLDKKQSEYEENRLEKVVNQIDRDLNISKAKIIEQRASLKEINKNMLSEFKFETESMVDLEGAAVLTHYQTMGRNMENAMEYQIQRMVELKRLKDNTYFAKLIFQEKNEDIEEIYIGSSSLIEENGFEYLVYDWRAPICSIFYDYEKGDVSYMAPGGKIDGQLHSKRHFKIQNGKIVYMFDSNINIVDEMLKEALAKSVDDKMKTIITTIQKEQNQVIRDESSDVLVVSGSAGSGKTSIALHRIAYLMYKNRQTIIPSDILIFTPNDIFSDYISHVLPDLGEKNVDAITFNDYMQSILGVSVSSEIKEYDRDLISSDEKEESDNTQSVGKEQDNERNQEFDYVDDSVIKCNWEEIESYYDQMEYLLSHNQDESYEKRIKSIMMKGSNEFFLEFDAFIQKIELRTDFFQDLYYKDQLLLSKEEMQDSYLDCANVIKCSSRLLQVQNRMLTKIREIRDVVAYNYEKQLIESPDFITKSDINRKVSKYIKRTFKPLKRRVKQMASLDLLESYNIFLSEKGLDPVGGKLNFEDALCLMYMKGRLDTIREVNKVKYLVIDEAQDYTLIHYKIISLIFGHCKYTLLGDPNQAIHPYLSSKVSGDIEDFLGTTPKHIRLTKTYRSTKQISEFCSKIINQTSTEENVLRDGNEVIVSNIDFEQEGEKIMSMIQEHLDQGLRSIALIGKTKEHCNRIYDHIQKLSTTNETAKTIRLLNNEEQLYKTGVIVIPSYLAKGLEFDSVMIIADKNFSYNHTRELQLFYTVCTRALHELAVFYSDEQPKLLTI